ncbi:MAG: neutral zinc metallopeptidase [Terricaulis sp.]
MADVFISYKRDERAAVEEIAARLRALGLQVWFDASLSGGETFNAEIDREARSASTILVCWSPAARESRWVVAEAMIGFEKDGLTAAYVAGPDGFSPPTPFNTIHAEDLRTWLSTPSDHHTGWRSLLRRIGKLCGRADIESYGALDAQASATDLRGWIATHETSPLFMVVDSWLQSREQQDVERARLEQEARARRAKEEAERRAQEAERQKQEEERRRLEAEERARAQETDAYFKEMKREFFDRPLQKQAQEGARKRAAAAKRSQQIRWGLFAVAALVGVYFLVTSGRPVLDRMLGGRAQETSSTPSEGGACEAQPQVCALVRDTLSSNENVWRAQFQQGRLPSYGPAPGAYQSPTLVMFSEQTNTGCGAVASRVGPFYCPADRRIYVDPVFDGAIARRFNPPGQFFQAYIIAHEVAHHVQNLMMGDVALRQPDETDAQFSMRLELQADCLEGVWGGNAWSNLAIDDATLRNMLATPHGGGDASTHGTSAQRMRWFKRGFSSSDARQCDTFGASFGEL